MPDLERLGWRDEDLLSYRDLARRTGHKMDWAKRLLRGVVPFAVEPGQWGMPRKMFRWSDVKIRLEEHYAEGIAQGRGKRNSMANRIGDVARAWRAHQALKAARRGDGTGGQGTGGASDPPAI